MSSSIYIFRLCFHMNCASYIFHLSVINLFSLYHPSLRTKKHLHCMSKYLSLFYVSQDSADIQCIILEMVTGLINMLVFSFESRFAVPFYILDLYYPSRFLKIIYSGANASVIFVYYHILLFFHLLLF